MTKTTNPTHLTGTHRPFRSAFSKHFRLEGATGAYDKRLRTLVARGDLAPEAAAQLFTYRKGRGTTG